VTANIADVLHYAGVRTVLELVDGAVVNGLLEQLSPLFHSDHIRHHDAYTVRTTYCAVRMLYYVLTPSPVVMLSFSLGVFAPPKSVLS